jgi:hypothetical protein
MPQTFNQKGPVADSKGTSGLSKRTSTKARSKTVPAHCRGVSTGRFSIRQKVERKRPHRVRGLGRRIGGLGDRPGSIIRERLS